MGYPRPPLWSTLGQSHPDAGCAVPVSRIARSQPADLLHRSKLRRGRPHPRGRPQPFYKLQPHAIALYTLQGIPMLWQGQEFADNYTLPTLAWRAFTSSAIRTGSTSTTPTASRSSAFTAGSAACAAVCARCAVAPLTTTTSSRCRGHRCSSTRATRWPTQPITSRGRWSRSTSPTATQPSTPRSPLRAPGAKCSTTPCAPRRWRSLCRPTARAAAMDVPSNYGQIWVKVS